MSYYNNNNNLTASIPGFKHSLTVVTNSRSETMTYDIPNIT